MFLRLLAVSFVCLLSLFSDNYEIFELKSQNSKKISTATSINEQGQIAGIVVSNLEWYIFDLETGITFIPTKSSSSIFYPGGYPYINESGVLSRNKSNKLGFTAFIENEKLFTLDPEGARTLIDENQKWISPYVNNPIINDNLEIVSKIKDSGSFKKAVFLDSVTGDAFYFSIKYDINIVDINNSGQVVGWYSADNSIIGFIWYPRMGQYTKIKNFRPAAINDSGVVVGVRNDKGAIYENGDVRVVDELLDLENDFSTDIYTVKALSDINNSNEMVGWGNGDRPVLIRKYSK